MEAASHLMRNFLINVFQEKSGKKRSHEEDQWNDSDVLYFYSAVGLRESVDPDGNVHYANDEE
jgi:hypothetical protein